ncbi:MAG: efflux RND transporter periplasmic adaptor subunit [Candidatus Riflebacteria bacterium]|nr:efflux RND transporter periplasmic adaptor subunit [Candidatus Riflebacteria bacterium]
MNSYPRFRPDLVVFDHPEPDGTIVKVLKDPVTERFFRLSAYEHRFLTLFDGVRSLPEVRQAFEALGLSICQEDAVHLLVKADQMGLMLGAAHQTAAQQAAIQKSYADARRASRVAGIYFMFIPLVNPDRFLERTLPLFRMVANRWAGLLVLLLAPGAVYLALSGLPRLDREFVFFFNLENLMTLWVTIALMKLFHELAHAYTAKSFGLRVPEMGVMLLLFFPCLFCNTTDAWQLSDRRQRMAVSAAGIVAESFLAIMATYVWYFSRPGMVNSLALYLMTGTFISTVLINGNPLMKLDGYFILIDLIRLPNLAAKSLAHLKYLLQNRFLGLDHVESPATTARESTVFTIYGVSSFLYRVVLYTGMFAGIYYRFDKVIGVVLAGMAFAMFLVRPVLKAVVWLMTQRARIRPRLAGSLVVLTIVAAVALLLAVPIRTRSVFPCLAGSALAQKITIPLLAAVADVRVQSGSSVRKGELLFTLDPEELELSVKKKVLEKMISEREYELALLDKEGRGRIQIKQVRLLKAEDEIARLAEKLHVARDGVRAPFKGVVTRLDPRLQRGFGPGEGVVVGELESSEELLVQALVPGQDRHTVRVGQPVTVWFPVGQGLTFTSRVSEIKPYGERDLRNSPLSSSFGGELATEIQGEDRLEAPLEAQYRCTIPWQGERPAQVLGMAGRISVPSPPRSLIRRFVDGVTRTFNRESFM